MAIKWIDFGEQGLSHVRDALHVAGSLGKEVLVLHEISSGRVTTPLPAGFEPGSLADIRDALEWGPEWEECHASFVDRVSERIAEPGAWMVFEGRHTKAAEAASLPADAPHYLLAGPDVHYVAVEGATREIIESVLRWASPWWTRGYVGMGGMARDVGRGGTVESHDIRQLAANTRAIVVGAFDEEGYLWWEEP